MSLVAYGASDESDVSEPEDNQVSNDRENRFRDKISDDEEYQAVSSSFTNTVASETFSHKALDIPHSTKLQQDLPPPQKRQEVTVEEDELEDEVRQKPSELANAPKPPKKTRQPVKITIPSLNDIDDDGDDVGIRKKAAASSAPSGLFALLPPPIHSAKKEINRPLIPHSLGKKHPTSKPIIQAPSISSSTQGNSAKSTAKASDLSGQPGVIHSALTSYGSDDEEEDETSSSQNFFSLKSSNEADPVSSTNNITEPTGGKIVSSNSTESAGDDTSVPSKQEAVQPEPALSNDSPLDFNNARKFSSWSSASSSYLGGWRPYQQLHSQVTSHSSFSQPTILQSSVQYNMVDTDTTGECEDSSMDQVPSEDLQQVINDKEFQKLQGKRKRGMEEAISFVDAKVDDYVDPSELSKYITEETEYMPKANKDDMPTSQQKRKKQITYLAFQAKEKELELKNTWSQNKLTKRQTQAKYGF